MDAFEILVIILSVTLAVFLILGIIAMVYVIKVVKSIRQMTDKASSAVDSVSSVATNISKFVTPAAAGKFIVDAVQKLVKNHDKKAKEDK